MLDPVRTWCVAHSKIARFDEPAGRLVDVGSGHSVHLGDEEVFATNLTPAGHLQITLLRGAHLSLTEAGIAFAPNFENTGPLPQLPPLVVFGDFDELVKRARAGLQKQGAIELQTLQATLFCQAIADGARLAGFDVDDKLKALEAMVSELERRAPNGPGSDSKR